MSGYRIIHVEFIYPPIPDRNFDYQATFDGYEPGDAIGHGPTVERAIEDLHESLEFDEACRADRAERNWQPTTGERDGVPIWLAPEGEEVWTKIHDEHGERNVQKLVRRGNLWWTSTGPDAIYIYYTPTHWKRS